MNRKDHDSLDHPNDDLACPPHPLFAHCRLLASRIGSPNAKKGFMRISSDAQETIISGGLRVVKELQ